MKSEPIVIQITLSIINGTAKVVEAKTVSEAAATIPLAYELGGLKKSDRKGDQSGTNKLTETQVREIKRLLKLGACQSALAKKFAVTPGAINHIATGSRWSHVK